MKREKPNHLTSGLCYSIPPVLLTLLGLACEAGREIPSDAREIPGVDGVGASLEGADGISTPDDLTGVAIVPERWVSDWDTTSNLDSPAVWRGEEGVWVVSTAKGTHDLWIHDATDGSFLMRFGGQGAGPGQLNYPNGITVFGDLLLVVERDNHRVQALSMPDFEPLGWFGEETLVRPYGIAVYERDDGILVVYVTDDYGNELDLPEGMDPSGDFTRRVKRFELQTAADGSPEATFLGAFGEARGPGALMVVESIQVDESQNLLLVADEHNFEVELYSLDGQYLDRTVGSEIYRSGDPEGIMLYRCGSQGYWVLTDQGVTRSVFHVLDRESFQIVGSFAGEVTANTDGIWLDQGNVPGLGEGVLIALHDDGGVSGFAWEDIARALGLRRGCRRD